MERAAKEMLSTLSKKGCLTTDYWGQIEAGSYIPKVCAAEKTDAEMQRSVSLNRCPQEAHSFGDVFAVVRTAEYPPPAPHQRWH